MFGNSRDAFGIALKKLGYSLNTENLEEIDKAADALAGLSDSPRELVIQYRDTGSAVPGWVGR